MAKELPYFKFIVSDWLTGDIVYESFELQGLFINICAIYWQREGNVSVEDLEKRFKNSELIAKLSDRFISLKDGYISIKFLDEQFLDRKHLSITNSLNGSLGGKAKALKIKEIVPNANRTLSEPLAKRGNIEKKRKEKKRIISKCFFKDSIFYDKLKFKESFPNWKNEKLKYYYEALDVWSNEGNKKIDWIATARTWANRDEKEGKIKFKTTINNHDTDGIL